MQTTGLIELITKCLTPDGSPLTKLKEICNIAVRAYQTNIDPSYEPPKHQLMPDMLTESEFALIEDSQKRFKAENLNDRSVIHYLKGDYSTAHTFASRSLEVNPSNLEAYLNMNLLEWRLSKLRDDELLQRAEQMNHGAFDAPTREFVRLMFKYAISYGFHETDLLSIGGYESSQFYPTMQKILKAVKRFIDQVRKEKESLLLAESTQFFEEDHVHQIFIANNEKHMLTVTVDKFKITSLDPKQPLVVVIDMPEEEAKESHLNEDEDSIQFAIDKQQDSLDSIDQLRV